MIPPSDQRKLSTTPWLATGFGLAVTAPGIWMILDSAGEVKVNPSAATAMQSSLADESTR